MKWVKSAILFLGGICSVSCMSDGSSAKTQVPVQPTAVVSFSQISLIPTIADSGQKFYLSINNDSPDSISLSSMAALYYTNAAKGTVISGDKTNLFDASQCKKIATHQSCLVAITPQLKNGGFVLEAKYHNAINEMLIFRQLIQYGDIPANNGFKVNQVNLNVVTKAPNYHLAVPFVLDDDYTSLEVDSKIQPLSQKIICQNNRFNKGNSCTALLSYKSGNYSNKLTILGDKSRQTTASKTKTGGKRLVVENALNSTTMDLNVSTNDIANLIQNGNNAIISTDHETLISVMNNGIAPLNISSISAGSTSLHIDPGSCSGATLNSNEVCVFSVISSSQGNILNSQITIASSLGNEIFNVIEIASKAAPGVTMLADRDLLYTIINDVSPQKVKLVVRNASTTATTLSNISFSQLNLPFSFVANSDSNACIMGADLALNQGESCTVVIGYQPTQFTALSHLSFMVSANYVESNASIGSLASKIEIPYSAVTSNAHIRFNPQDPSIAAIRADNLDSIESIITITNDGGVDATNLTIDTSDLTTIPGTRIVANNCNGSLAAQAACSITVGFGPLNQNITAASQPLKVSYTSNPNSATGATINVENNLTFNAMTAALIRLTGPVDVTSESELIGLVVSSDNYQFYPTPGHYLRLKYHYLNDGAAAADSFNLNLNNLPVGGSLDETATTCASGISVQSLAVGGSCDVIIQFINDQILTVFGADMNYSLSAPGYSYHDANTGVNITTAATAVTAINAHAWATLTTTVESLSATSKRLNFTLTKASDPAIAGGTSTIVLPSLTKEGFSTQNNSCSISGSSGVCSIDIEYPDYLPHMLYYIEWHLTTNSGAAVGLPLSGKAPVMIP